MSDRDDAAPTDGDVPRIVLRHLGAEGSLIEHVEHGIEEEGVPWVSERIEADESGSNHRRDGPAAIAYRAASDSGLEIGIGAEGGDVALHHARLAADDPLFSVANATTLEARTVGTNAARLAKRMPLRLLD